MIADLVGFVAGVTFMATMIAALLVSRGGTRVSLRRLTVAIRLYVIAIVAEAGALVAHLADVQDDGWIWPLLSAATLTCAVLALRATWERRALRGDRVVADAEQTVREWTGGAL